MPHGRACRSRRPAAVTSSPRAGFGKIISACVANSLLQRAAATARRKLLHAPCSVVYVVVSYSTLAAQLLLRSRYRRESFIYAVGGDAWHVCVLRRSSFCQHGSHTSASLGEGHLEKPRWRCHRAARRDSNTPSRRPRTRL